MNNFSRNYILGKIDEECTYLSLWTRLTLNASVQTVNTKSETGYSCQAMTSQDALSDQDLAELSASDMASILKWSSTVTSDIDLSSSESLMPTQ